MSEESGIYVITCTLDSKIYVGSTVNFAKRWREHSSALKRGKHHNQYLQSAWNKYGEACFTFAILEYCDPENLFLREQYYFDLLEPFNERGFNGARYAEKSALGRKHSLESIAKMSAAHKGRKQSPEEIEKRKTAINNPEVLAKMSASAKRRGTTPEAKQKRAEALRSPEVRAKISTAHKGLKHSPDTRAKISEAGKGRNHSQQSIARMVEGKSKTYIVTSPTGETMIVRNMKAFCSEHDLCRSSMSNVAKGKRHHTQGWKCEFVNEDTQ